VKLTEPEDVKRIAKQSGKAQLEQRFLEAWGTHYQHLQRPVMQHRFHPVRKWRWDFCWPDQKLAVEIQGGSFVQGGHNRAGQQQKDYEKQRTAVSLGWRVLPFNTIDMKDPESVVTFVAQVLTNAKEIS
jgi:very-short-patch-repair endonuclease